MKIAVSKKGVLWPDLPWPLPPVTLPTLQNHWYLINWELLFRKPILPREMNLLQKNSPQIPVQHSGGQSPHCPQQVSRLCGTLKRTFISWIGILFSLLYSNLHYTINLTHVRSLSKTYLLTEIQQLPTSISHLLNFYQTNFQ